MNWNSWAFLLMPPLRLQTATKESVFDGPLATYYTPDKKWENYEAFDPSMRWTYREERTARRKVDWKVFFWMLIMFLALNIASRKLQKHDEYAWTDLNYRSYRIEAT
jgi:hypothetical protein